MLNYEYGLDSLLCIYSILKSITIYIKLSLASIHQCNRFLFQNVPFKTFYSFIYCKWEILSVFLQFLWYGLKVLFRFFSLINLIFLNPFLWVIKEALSCSCMHTLQRKWHVGLQIYCFTSFGNSLGQFWAETCQLKKCLHSCPQTTRWPHIPLTIGMNRKLRLSALWSNFLLCYNKQLNLLAISFSILFV